MNDASKALFIAAGLVALIGLDIDIVLKIKQNVPPVAQTNPFKPAYPQSPPAQDMEAPSYCHDGECPPLVDRMGNARGAYQDSMGNAQALHAGGDTAEACIKRGGQPNYLENPKQYLNCYGKVVHGELGDTYEIK